MIDEKFPGSGFTPWFRLSVVLAPASHGAGVSS